MPALASRLAAGHDCEMADRAMVRRWLAAYEAAWRAPGTHGLAEIFTDDASYRQSPYQEPVAGLDAIRRMWDAERDGPDEVFTVATDILAVDGPTAVVRAEVRYGVPLYQEYRDLWIMQLGGDGRCIWFEEWPYWPGQPRAAAG
jgi:ketosteroid isomerase-like protein